MRKERKKEEQEKSKDEWGSWRKEETEGRRERAREKGKKESRSKEGKGTMWKRIKSLRKG